MDLKHSHLLKFMSFLYKNSDAPFSVKETVWQSALTSSIMYGCETWLSSDLRNAEAPYMSSLKLLLGVRSTTCNDLALLEAGVPSPRCYIVERQRRFIHKLMSRTDFDRSYVGKFLLEAQRVKSPMGKCITTLLASPAANITDTARSVTESQSTRRSTYRSINPNLTRPKMYGDPNCPEYARLAATRLRLGSHRLQVETGRWSRIPRDQRTCSCPEGAVQDEHHVLIDCPLTLPLRLADPDLTSLTSIPQLFDSVPPIKAAVYCHKVISRLT